MREFRIGTRGSLLALAQTREILRRLKSKNPGFKFRIIVIKTEGDEFQGTEIFKEKKTGLFTKTIERKLLEGGIDVAVHSLKDLPTDLPKGLRLGAVPRRSRVNDALVSRRGHTLHNLPGGAVVGTGSARRKRQLLRARPDLDVRDIRGNLDTRIAKVLKEKSFDAVVVARAGLERLGKYLQYARNLPEKEILPAVGQGALGLEIREGDRETLKILKPLNHEPTRRAVLAERAFLKTLRGGCRVPVGIASKITAGRLRLKAAVFSSKSMDILEAELSAPSARYEKAGSALARGLLKKGAGKFLKEARL